MKSTAIRSLGWGSNLFRGRAGKTGTMELTPMASLELTSKHGSRRIILMRKLNNEVVERTSHPERVLQFGEGNFLRAFIDWMIHRMNEAEVFDGSAVVVQPLDRGMVDLLNAQDSLYTLYLRGIMNGKTVNRHEVVRSVSRGINPYAEWRTYLETALILEMRFVVSNTTEAGIDYVRTEKPSGVCPASFPAKLTAWLAERCDTFGGTAESGIICMPCELINHNGTKLKECVLKHAFDWKLGGDFIRWIEEDCVFLNTLVDRIVPGYPADEAAAMQAELAYTDQLLCAGEIFHLLVIEGPEALKAELPFHEAGLNVVWTDDLQPYRTRKVGVLNGAHTASVVAAFLGGLDTVGEMMADEVFGAFVRQVVFNEIIPTLPMDRRDAESYAESVMERFCNPFIQHQLLSICLNSVSKWKVRVLPSVKVHAAQQNGVPSLLAFSLAALITFYKGEGTRDEYEVQDDVETVRFFQNVWRCGDGGRVVNQVLSNQVLWDEDLTKLTDLESAVAEALDDILTLGARSAVQKRLG